MKALLAIAAAGATLASFSAPASADPFDHFRFERRDAVHVGWVCGRDQHLNHEGYCVWDRPHEHAEIVIVGHPFWR